MRIDNKGFSLITTLVLSAVALAFISALIYFVQSGSRTSASVESYKSSLEIAKGASEFLIAGVYNEKVGFGHIDCDSDLGDVNDYLSPYDEDTETHTVEVTSFKCERFNNNYNELYLIKLRVQRTGSEEKAEVEFGYLKEYDDE
ncbi:MAG: hypothetical protein AB7E48_04955 [Deferribacterales bacterium]